MNTPDEHFRNDGGAPQNSIWDVVAPSVEQQLAAIVGNRKPPMVSGWMVCQSRERLSDGGFGSGWGWSLN